MWIACLNKRMDWFEQMCCGLPDGGFVWVPTRVYMLCIYNVYIIIHTIYFTIRRFQPVYDEEW